MRTQTSAVAVLGLLAAFIASANGTVQFDIPTQSLADSLRALGAQAHINVIYDPPIVERHVAPALRGAITAEAALAELLKGTGLEYQFVTEKTVSIRIAGTRTSSNTSSIFQPTALPDGEGRGDERRLHLAQSASSPDLSQGEDMPKDADEEAAKLEEIVITAQKREERSIDVPMSITAKSGEELVAAGIKNVRDLSYAVPSLSVYETGPGRQMIIVRGIGSFRGTSSLTGLYLDELPISGLQDSRNPAYADLIALDLDRVEVLKGPQGTLFGEGAAGGVLRFITKDPDLSRLGGELSTEFSNTADGGWSEEVSGVVNVPLANDVFGIRVAAKYENISGWIDQPAGIPAITTSSGPISQPSIGREDINDSEVKHVRVKALYAPTSELRLTALAEIHRNKGGGSNVVNQEPFEDSNFVQAFDRNAPTGYYDDYDMFNLTVTYDFAFAELLSSTSYANIDSSQSETQLLNAQTGPWLEILVPAYQNHSTGFTQEFRFTSVQESAFNWTFGANYKDAELIHGFGDAGFSACIFGSICLPPGLSAGEKPTKTSKSWAGFADVSYEFLNRLEVGGGLRYFSDKRESFNLQVSPVILSGDFSKTTYRAYLKYAFSPDANVYISTGTGFRSGDFNDATAVANGAPQKISPETTLSYELGTKLRLLNGRIRLDAAAFYTEYQDMFANRTTFSPTTTTGLVTFTANGQDAKIKGVEWEMGWAITNRLDLTLAGDVTDTEITQVDATDTAPVYVVGDPVNFAPKHSASAIADYRFQWAAAMPGFLRLSFDRQGKSYCTERSNVLIIDKQFIAPAVSFFSASIGGEWNGWNWNLFGRNLLNEDGPLNASLDGVISAQARPRTIGVGISKSF